MLSLSSHVRLHYVIASMLVGLVLFLALLAYVVHAEIHDARIRLKFIGNNVLQHLNDNPPPVDEEELARLLRWADWQERVSLTVLDRHGRTILSLGEHPVDGAEWRTPADDYYRFDWGARDFERLWYRLYYQRGDYRFILSELGHEETVEEVLGGLAAFLVLLVVLSIVLGHRVSAGILAPIHAIADTARQLRHGKLDQRIQLAPTHSELHDLADNLNRTFDELQKLCHQARDFSGSAAHELRTPLTALRGKLDVALRRERTAEDYADVMHECMEDIVALQRIIDTLLLTTRPQSEFQQNAFETVNLSAVVQDAVEHLRPLAEEKSIDLKVSVAEQVTCFGVPTFLGQLTVNLVHNAIKFTPEGGSVEISLVRQEDDLVLTVRDTGIGLAADDHEKVFERFYQVDNSRTQGTGLGLSLVRWIADLHNAVISLTSQPGEGTTFIVRIPAD